MVDARPDVIVVGAGIIGLATAYELTKRGLRVTVVDQQGVGAGASYGNAGLIGPWMCEPMVAPHHLAQGLKWVVTRGAESPLQFRWSQLPAYAAWGLRTMTHCTERNFSEGKAAFDALGAGTWQLLDEYLADGVGWEEHMDQFMYPFLHAAELQRKWQSTGDEMGARVLSGDEARDLEPTLSDDVVGGILVTRQFRTFYPPSQTTGLASRLGELGVDIRVGVTITGSRQSGGTLEALVTESGECLEADQFVIAAGAWSGLLAKSIGSRIPLLAGKGYSITIQDPSPAPELPLFLVEYESVCIPYGDRLRYTGFLELSGVNEDPRPRRFAALRRIIGRYLRQVPTGSTEEEWTGMRACSPDGRPIIGRLPGLDNGWVGTGHWHCGMMLAPVTGVMLAEQILTGTSSVDPRPFDPARFR